jgi:hypothetical protein
MMRPIAASVAIVAIAVSGVDAASQNGSDKAAELIRELKAASGGAALDRPEGFHESGTLTRDGKPGVYEYWGDLRALRSVGSHTIEGKTGLGGFDGKQAWSVDPAGKVLIDASPKGVSAARLGTYVSIGGYFYPDRFPATFVYHGRRRHGGALYDVVTVTPKDGDSADLWLDAKTHRLARLSAEAGGVKVSGDILRYQVVDGTWIGFALSQTEGQHQMTQQLAKYVYGPVDGAKFSPPPPS